LSGERLDWKSSIPISSGVCIFQPGLGCREGARGRRAQPAWVKAVSPRWAAAGIEVGRPAAAGGGDGELIEVEGREPSAVTRSASGCTSPEAGARPPPGT